VIGIPGFRCGPTAPQRRRSLSYSLIGLQLAQEQHDKKLLLWRMRCSERVCIFDLDILRLHRKQLSVMAATCEEPLTLLSLPQELRLQIWSLAFTGISVQLSRHHRDKKPWLWRTRYGDQVCMYRRDDLNILLLCRSIWNEARQCIQTAGLTECDRGSGSTLTNYHVCDLMLHEVEHLKIKSLITTCPRPECIRAIIQHRPCPGLKVIEWYTKDLSQDMSIHTVLPRTATSSGCPKNEWIAADEKNHRPYRLVGIAHRIQFLAGGPPIRLSIRRYHEKDNDLSCLEELSLEEEFRLQLPYLPQEWI
jgi:hypothetical protein